MGHRGHKDDPLRKIRGLLRHGVEHLTDKQQAKIVACLDAGDPNGEVNLAWQRYQQVRSIYHAGAETGRTICQKVLDSCPSCPIPEVARLGRTLKAWRQQVLAYFDTTAVSNGGTEAINLIIEKVRRLAQASGISSATGSGSCSPPQASADTENAQTTLNSEELPQRTPTTPYP